MAHYAKLNEQDIVVAVIVIADDMETTDGVLDENKAIRFCASLTGHESWKKTSFNNKIRKQFAGIGYTYDRINDVFVSPKPYASWTLDNNFDWQPPIARPDDGNIYSWDESSQTWNIFMRIN